jgi:hypothetical protein
MTTVDQARQMILGDYLLYTVSPSTGKSALVEASTCHCGLQTLSPKSDAVKDNNLDDLPHRNWRVVDRTTARSGYGVDRMPRLISRSSIA